jgi:hypothetical protein
MPTAKVVAIGQDTPAAGTKLVDRHREMRSQRHHPTTERSSVVGLHEEVRVVALQREVNDTEVGARADARQGRLEGAHEANGAEARRTG